MTTFQRRTRIECPAAELYRWHARPGAFERLTPPWSQVEIVERTGGIESGSRVVMRMHNGPVATRWVAEHRDTIEGEQFYDVQVEGPFARWEHCHRFEAAGQSASILDDRIDYELPLGALGSAVGGGAIERMLDRMFRYRHTITRGDLEQHARYAGAPLRVLVTGASGLVGSALTAYLSTGGHHVSRAVRRPQAGIGDSVGWDPENGLTEMPAAPWDAVVHLAGENIAGGRWTDSFKQRVLESRSVGTRRLCESLARLPQPPRVLVSASAIGFYGDRGDSVVDEESERGSGFLADVCDAWEASTQPARDAGIRVVHLRIGVVLTRAGGALTKMLPPFWAGLGGRVGSGEQYLSWIGLDDLLGAVLHCIRTEGLAGPVNAVAPQAARNDELTRVLGEVLSRPTWFPVPAFALRLAMGEMADEMLLASTRVAPTRLQASGYTFRQPDLAGALRATLGR